MAKFYSFEEIIQLFSTHAFTISKESYSKPLSSGSPSVSVTSGVVCAIVFHPADSLVSLLGKPGNEGESIGAISSETGFVALAAKGLRAGVVTIGTLTGFQWWIYDSFKSVIGMGTIGGE